MDVYLIDSSIPISGNLTMSESIFETRCSILEKNTQSKTFKNGIKDYRRADFIQPWDNSSLGQLVLYHYLT